MSSQDGLDAPFKKALEEEEAALLRAEERLFEECLMAALKEGRRRCEEFYNDAVKEWSAEEARLREEQDRSLKVMDAEGQRVLTALVLSRLEETMEELIAALRKERTYGAFLCRLLERAREMTGGLLSIKTLDADRSLLSPQWAEVAWSPLEPSDWGGVMAWGKEGTVLDFTFRTGFERCEPQKMVAALCAPDEL